MIFSSEDCALTDKTDRQRTAVVFDKTPNSLPSGS